MNNGIGVIVVVVVRGRHFAAEWGCGEWGGGCAGFVGDERVGRAQKKEKRDPAGLLKKDFKCGSEEFRFM